MIWMELMKDRDILKDFGPRLKALRKRKKWTQKELANKIGVRFPQLNKYECGLHAPPVSKLIELSELLETSLDYLLTGNTKGEGSLHNLRLLERFKALENFQGDDQETVIKLIDAFIKKQQIETVLSR